jgi:SAM-dependent methyltransferase
MKVSGDWFADESFWAALYPFIFPPERFEAAGHEAEAILALVGRRPASLLDLCCGAGRHSVAFGSRGIAVTGVDRSAFLLAKAREHAGSLRVNPEWVQADMREFVRPAAFDVVVNLFTSFGYFDDARENALVAANMFASLKAGGVLVLDVVGKEIAARAFEGSGTQNVAGAGLLVQRRRVVDDWCRVENEWLVVEKGVVRAFRFRHWLYSGRELKELLAAAGFDPVVLHGSFDGGEYGPEATRLIAVARKPERGPAA